MPENQSETTVKEVAEIEQINVNMANKSIIPFISSKISGNKILNLDETIDAEITINNKVFKQSFTNEEQYQQTMRLVNNLSNEVNEDKLHKLNFRSEFETFNQVIINNWKTIVTVGLISVASAIGSTLLMTRDGELLIKGDGDGIWSAPQARDGVGATARAINALAPFALTIFSAYVKDNRYAWDEEKYCNLQVAIKVCDLGAMFATLAETYAFNRGKLDTKDIYRVKAIFEKDNFKKVFLNDFSGAFLPEQILRTIKNTIDIVHHKTRYISSETVQELTSLINHVSGLAVAGAFSNVIYGINNYHGQNPGHGIDILPSNSKIKSSLGIIGAATGAYHSSINTIKSFIKWTSSLCTKQDNGQNRLNQHNPTINATEEDNSSVLSSSETIPILSTNCHTSNYDATLNIGPNLTSYESLENLNNWEKFYETEKFITPLSTSLDEAHKVKQENQEPETQEPETQEPETLPRETEELEQVFTC